jgi:hypothetical protein
MPPPPSQLDLFGAIAEAYADSPDGSLENRSLYRQLAQRPELQLDIERRVPIGAAGALHSRGPLAFRAVYRGSHL